MKVSKRDFLRLLGGGTAATASALAHGEPIPQREGVAGAEPPQAGAMVPTPRVSPPTFGWLNASYLDIVDRVLYDRITMLAGSTLPANVGFFQTQMGLRCPYSGLFKTLQQTNLCQSGCMPAPSMLWIRRIHIVIADDVDAATRRELAAYAWQFWMGAKCYADGTVLMDAQTATVADARKGRLLSTRQTLELDASNGLFVPSQLCFHAHWQAAQPHVLPGDADFMMALEGVEVRSVQ